MVSSGLHFTQFSFMWFIYNRKKQNNALPFTFFCVLHYIIKLNKIVSIPFQNWKYVQMIVGNWKMRRIHNTPSKRMQNKNILRQNFMIWQPRYAALQWCVLPFEKPLLIHSETKRATILYMWVYMWVSHWIDLFSKTLINSGTKLPRVAPTVDTQQ